MGLREDRRARAKEQLPARVKRTSDELGRVLESVQGAGASDETIAALENTLDRWDEFVATLDADTLDQLAPQPEAAQQQLPDA